MQSASAADKRGVRQAPPLPVDKTRKLSRDALTRDSPSVRDGIPLPVVAILRRSYCQLINEAGMALGMCVRLRLAGAAACVAAGIAVTHVHALAHVLAHTHTCTDARARPHLRARPRAGTSWPSHPQ